MFVDFCCSSRKVESYSNDIPPAIGTRAQELRRDYPYHADCVNRTVAALERIEHGKKIDLPGLTKDELSRLAKKVNSAGFHCSGNCVLLASCMLYNLKHGAPELAAKNVSPVYEGLNSDVVGVVLFGQQWEKCAQRATLKEAEADMLRVYEETGNRFFVLETSGYQVPFIGECGHCANAVILLDENQQPHVQIVDAWKTWGDENVPTQEAFAKRYVSASEFQACWMGND